jgi:hypothetical protein
MKTQCSVKTRIGKAKHIRYVYSICDALLHTLSKASCDFEMDFVGFAY